jgi:hypothetical protein
MADFKIHFEQFIRHLHSLDSTFEISIANWYKIEEERYKNIVNSFLKTPKRGVRFRYFEAFDDSVYKLAEYFYFNYTQSCSESSKLLIEFLQGLLRDKRYIENKPVYEKEQLFFLFYQLIIENIPVKLIYHFQIGLVQKFASLYTDLKACNGLILFISNLIEKKLIY